MHCSRCFSCIAAYKPQPRAAAFHIQHPLPRGRRYRRTKTSQPLHDAAYASRKAVIDAAQTFAVDHRFAVVIARSNVARGRVTLECILRGSYRPDPDREAPRRQEGRRSVQRAPFTCTLELGVERRGPVRERLQQQPKNGRLIRH